jgi:hypothetical protein
MWRCGTDYAQQLDAALPNLKAKTMTAEYRPKIEVNGRK